MSEHWKGLQDGFTLFSKRERLSRRIEKLHKDMEREEKEEEGKKLYELWEKCDAIQTYADPFLCDSQIDACRQSADNLFRHLDFVKQEVEAWEAKDDVAVIWTFPDGHSWTQKLDESVHFYCEGFKQGFGLFYALDKLEDQILRLRKHTGGHQTMPEEEEKLSNLQLYSEQMCNLLIRKE
jgi:hypothetical protein